MTSIREQFKTSGMYAVGCVVVVGIFVLCGLFLKGMVWASDKALPWLMTARVLTFVVCIVVLLPLLIFRRTRVLAANGFYVSSYVFGIMLWAYSCVVAYDIWGYGGLVIGLILAGIGVLPVACLATLLHGYWSTLGELIIGTLLTFGTRLFAIYLMEKAEREQAMITGLEN